MAKSYEEILKELQERTKNINTTPSDYSSNEYKGQITQNLDYDIAKRRTELLNNNLNNSIKTITPINSENNLYKNRESLLNRENWYKNYEKTNEIMDKKTAQDIGLKLMATSSLSQKENLAKQYQKTYDFKISNNEELKNNFQKLAENRINAGIEENWSKYYKDLQEAQNENYNLWDKTGGRLLSGMLKTVNLAQGPQVKDENGKWYNLPTTQDIKNSAVAEQTENSILRFTGDVLFNTGRIATSAVLNKLVPGLGSTSYFSSMYLDNYNNARQNGYDEGRAGIYSTISTATELLTEKLLGGTTKALTGGKASALNQGIANGLSKIMNNKTMINILSHAGSEATEEFIQEYIDNITRNVVLGENNNIWSEDVLGDALYSAAVGGVTGVFGSIGDNSLDIKTKKDLQQNNSNLSNTNTLNSLQNITQNNNYQYVPTDNQKINSLKKSASQYFDNSQQTHNFINALEKIASDKNYNVTFDNNLTSKNDILVNAQINTNKNGEVEIKINPNSNRVGEFLIMHEVTHAIETDSMKQLIIDYASKNSEFNDSLTSLKQTYGTNDVSSEVIADISGQLFGNQEFINNLSMEQPSVFKRIYNAIISMANKITGNSRESLFIKDLKNKWETAYRIQSNNLSNTEYMMTGLKGAKKAIKNDSNNQFLMDNYNKADQMAKKGLDNETIRQKTGWFQDTKGDWKFEISDHEAKITSKLEKDKTYKLGDILEHNDLYEMYPDLKEIKVKFKELKSLGKYYAEKNEIQLSNNKLNLPNSKMFVKSTLLHEIQHYIQHKENFTPGTSIKLGNKQYAESLGEIEATDTQKRIALNEYERLKKLPESAKKNPTHPYKEQIINRKRSTIEKITEKLYNKFGSEDNADIEKNISNVGENLQPNIRDNGILSRGRREVKHVQISEKNNQEVVSPNSSQNNKLVDERGLLENNSSFSMENDKWQSHLEKNYKATGTRSNMQEIKLPKENNQNKINLSKKEVKLPTKHHLDIKTEARKIAKEIMNENRTGVKQRKWVETSTESDSVKGKILIDDLKETKINYVVQSNKKTLKNANDFISSNGYDSSLAYIQSKMSSKDISLNDVAIAERVLQEAINHKDMKIAQDLLMDISIIGTELGQKVQALSMIQRLTPEGQLLMFQKLIQRAKAQGDKTFDNVEITPKMVENILSVKNEDGSFDYNLLNQKVEEFKQDIANQLKSTIGEKITDWRYLSMLGNPKTHIRNLVSNVAMAGTIKVKNAMARTLETVLPVKDRTKTFKKTSEDVKNFTNKIVLEMKDIIQGEVKYGEKQSIINKKQTYKNKVLQGISDFNSNALSTEDWWFSKSSFKNTLNEYLTANGIKTTTDIKNNPEIIEKGKLYALEQAEIATFRQYSKMASNLNRLEKSSQLAKLGLGATVPFKKTPINVAKAGVNYSPIGLIKNVFYDGMYQLKNGNITGAEFIDKLSQGITGTGLTILGFSLAKAGILSGADDDDKESKYENKLGNTGYSLKLGDSSYSISWLSPVAMPLLVGSTAYKQLVEKEEWDVNVVTDTLAKTLDPLSEMSFLSSLDDVLKSYDSGTQKFMAVGESVAQNYIGQFFPTLLSQVAATFDDKKRTTSASKNSKWTFGEETLRSIMYKIPGLRTQLEASTDIWGNEIKTNESILGRALESFLIPYSKRKDITTELDSEIKKVYKSTGESSVIPSTPKSYIQYKEQNYKMSASEYTTYKKTFGTTANEYLNNLIDNSFYKNASDEQKTSMIKEVYDYANTMAKEEYFKGHDIEYSSNELKKIQKFKELKMDSKSIAEYVALDKINNNIKSSKDYTTSEKHTQIANNIINSNLNDKQMAYLYSKYYSNEEDLNNLITMKIPIKEFIKLNSQNIESDYNENTGKTISNSGRNKYINAVNELKLNVAQKAILIKSKYNSYKEYDTQIVNYVNQLKATVNDKKILLKSIGFNNYNKDVIDYINSQNISKTEKEKKLKFLGFTIRNGKVYS